ncbi:MAG TPA: hypothetical protein VLJ37_06265 [bacterium]|nr:hypothetical protein [bacterium]
MTRKFSSFVAFLCLFLSSVPDLSAEFQVPEPLKPWTAWVLKGREDQLCPFFNGTAGTLCRWVSPMDLSLDDTKGSFSVQARIFEEAWIPLPGDADHWPQEVRAGGNALALVERDGRPQVFVPKGTYALTGVFSWDRLPDSLALPAEIGVVRLTLRGSPAARVQRDEDGRLWLESKPMPAFLEPERDRLEVRVHRLLIDEVPFTMTTRITLEVSGKTRDVLLPSPLPEGFIPMSLESPIPAELEKDGKIRVQAKTGTWDLELRARHHGPVKEIALGASDIPWPEEEVWAFEARNELRLVNVTGVPAIDPTQTTLPEAWKSHPAYRIRPGETIAFDERRRGASTDAPDRISLDRNLWLDFDGRGYTVRDAISGTMVKSARLEVSEPLALGHVSVNGKDQLITSLGEGKRGVEIRQGGVTVQADSRIESGARSVPATGWGQTFERVTEVLQLPPGWRAFAVFGADAAPATWLGRWTLLEIFLVLIIALSFAKLWGVRWGVAALSGLGLTATEAGAPLWAWIAVLIGAGLLRFLPEGRFRRLVRLYRIGAVLVLIVVAVPFLVDQVRMGLYPSLEPTGAYPMPVATSAGGYGAMAPQAEPMPPPPPPAALEVEADRGLEEAPRVQQEVSQVAKSESMARMVIRSKAKKAPSQLLNEYQPGAKVQTGPGLPEWSWRRVEIIWWGPVEEGESLFLVLIPPFLNLLLSFARVALLALLLARVLERPFLFRPGRKAAAAAAALAMMLVGSQARAEFPTPDLLQELQNRLLERPECQPHCATIPRMRLEVSPQSLTARMEVHVEAASAVPLPGTLKEWSPTEVMVGGAAVVVKPGDKGKAAAAGGTAHLTRTGDGRLWIVLDAGVHQVLMTGPLPDRQNVQVPLPLKPRYIEAKAEGWSLLGLHEDGVADDNLQLVRSQIASETSPASQGRADSGAALPAFLTVERRIILGLTWEVETRVARETPVGTAVVVQVPLLVGESVTTPGMRVEGGKVTVNLGPQATEVSWRSALLESPTIPLKADDSTWWTEVWTIEASPIWHVRMEGIPVVHHFEDGGDWLPTFRPWPGEEAVLHVFRPEAVEGPTLTIDRSRLTLTPGSRSTEASVALSIRSSLGGQHTITLPEGAELKSVSINGSAQPIAAVGDKVTLPVVPGAQAVELAWNEPRGISTHFRAPALDLGAPSVNAEARISIPRRWVLWASGPRLGPAVLFWGLVVVLALIAVGLGRVRLTPLKAHHWFLLGLGLTQVPIWSSIFVALWLLALGWRRNRDLPGRFVFDLRQLFVVGLTVAALVVLVFSIERGLLGIPVMQIEGNGSSDSLLLWFQDRISTEFPRPWVVTLPMYVYRIAMLVWAVWLAMALLKWLKWGWECFSTGGLWRPLRNRLVQK